jgi:predicted outer membrane repeat protein
MFKTIFAKNKLVTILKSVGLCIMSACICLSAVLSMPRKTAFASGTGVSQVESLSTGSKVYFGEYPQSTVINVKEWKTITLTTSSNSSEEIVVPYVVDSDSVNIHTKIKTKIEALIKKYYSTAHTVDGKTTEIKENYEWGNTTIGYFAPREDYADEDISYDNSTGYYTLLKPITVGTLTYSAGSKFYPYNRVVDSVNKYYKVKKDSSTTSDFSGEEIWLDASKSDTYNHSQPGIDPDLAPIRAYDGVRDESAMMILSRNYYEYDGVVRDKNQVVALHGYDRFQTSWIDNSDTVDEVGDETGTGVDGIFLYEVEPIEWVVVDSASLKASETSGNYKMLVSTQIIDSNAINHNPWTFFYSALISYGKSFNNSVLKAWLNGESSVDVTSTSSISSTTYTDTFYQSNRTFYDLAFSNNESDLQSFYRTTSSSITQKVGLLDYADADSNNIKSAYKTQYALANGDQGALDKYRWLLDDTGHDTIVRIESEGVESWIGSNSTYAYSILGVRPVICLDISTFANSNNVGDIDAGDTLNIGEPLKANENYDVKNANLSTSNLLHIKSDGVVDGSITVTQSGEIPEDSSDDSYGKTYSVTASNITINGKSAVTGFIVAGIRTYTNIKDSSDSYSKQFVPASSYLGGEGSSSTITLSNVEGQFVLTFYLIFKGNAYFISADKITNPIIYTTMSNSSTSYVTNSGRSPFSPVSYEVARCLSGNGVDLEVGNMSTLYFSEVVELSTDYSFEFKYQTVFQSSITESSAFQISTGESAILENIIFDGQDVEREKSFVSVNGSGSATFNNCVIKNANGKSNGGALNVESNAKILGTKLEVSNSRTTGAGGGIYCEGQVDMSELILTNNYASSGSASLTATTTSGKSFNISTGLYVTNNKERITNNVSKYSNYAVSISGYQLYIKNPTFKENNIFDTALYLDNCRLLSGKDVTFEGGSFERNNARGENGYASAMIVDANGAYNYKFSETTFEKNSSSASGYGTVLVKGLYQSTSSDSVGVCFDGCTFKGNNGLYSGGLSFGAVGTGDNFSGNFEITNTNFYGNEATSTNSDAIAGALLVKSNSAKGYKKLEMSNLKFTGNKAKHYGVANFILDGTEELVLEDITVGGDLNNGNNLDAVRNVSTGSGALFAIKCKSNELSAAISISKFVAKYNQKKDDESLSNFANYGVLYLENVVSKDDILIKNSEFINNDGMSNGGALTIQDCSGIVQNCLFESNRAFVSGNKNLGVGGGAVYLSSIGSESEIEIKNTTFIGNSVTASGEGLFVGGGAILSCKTILKLTDVYVSGNSVAGGEMIAKGGAICSYGNVTSSLLYSTKCQHSSPKLIISGGKFDENFATSSTLSQGGAVWGECVQIVTGEKIAGCEPTNDTSNDIVIFSNDKTTSDTPNGIVIFSNNKTKKGEIITGEGGAIYTANCFEILNEKAVDFVVTFEGNYAQNGGAVRACGVAIIDGAKFEENIAQTQNEGMFGFGGAISLGNSELTIKYSDYVNDSPNAQSGTAYALPMSAKIVRATFIKNEANYGGAIYSDSAIDSLEGFAKFSTLNIVGVAENAVIFENNKAVLNKNMTDISGLGGAIYAKSPLKIDTVLFNKNEANYASTIYFDNSFKTFTQASSNYVASDKLTVSNVTFEGNISNGFGVVGATSSVDITINNSTFTGNKNKGAVLVFSKQSGNLSSGTLDNCSFTNNVSEANPYLSDVISVEGCEVVIKDCTFAQNGDTTKSGYGTAILVGDEGVVYLNNVKANGTNDNKISHTNGFILVRNGGNLNVSGGAISYLKNTNSSLGGGAIVVYGRASFDGITLSYCEAQNGGAIYVCDGGNVSFAGTISNCTATDNGGAIYVQEGATLLVSGKLKIDLTYSESIISNNTAQNGGGVFSFGDTTVSRASILSNTASKFGGGVCSKENSSLTIEQGAIISENKLTSSDSFGAGIYAIGSLYINGAEISNNKFEEQVTNGVGGGLYADSVSFEARDTIFSGNKASMGGAIFATNGAISLSYLSFDGNSATTGGAVYLQRCTTNILSSEFSKNTATGNGRAVLFTSGQLVVQDSSFDDGGQSSETGVAKLYVEDCVSFVLSNCEFGEENGGNISHLYVKASKSAEILDSNFSYGKCDGDESGVVISAPNVWVENCNFNQNADGGLSLTTNYGIIANSKFLSNKKNGGLKLNKLDEDCLIEIIDSSFTDGNVSTSGSAIYVSNGVNLRLSGEIIVTGNSSSNGAIYIAETGKIVITRGSKVVISGNTTTSTSNLQSNLKLNVGGTAFLEGGLVEGSSIGVTLQSGSVVVQSPTDTNIPLENDDIKKFFSDDNSSYYLSYSSNKRQLLAYSKSSTTDSKMISVTDTYTYSLILSDITLLYSNMPKGGYVIDKSYFEVKNNNNVVDIVSMTFSLKEGASFLEEHTDSITLHSKGSYTLGIAVKKIRIGESEVELKSSVLETTKNGLAGEIVVQIVGEYLYIISTPQAKMISQNESSFKLTQAGLVKRSNGQEVAGTWSLLSPESVVNSGYYDCKFTPKQTSLYENKDNVTAKMYVEVVYNKMYYMTVGKDTAIYADSEGKNKINVSSFAEALEYLNDDGTFVFKTSYSVQGSETIAISKRVKFVRENSEINFAMIEVNDGGNLTISCTGGQALFEGKDDSTQSPLFVVNGRLTLGANVEVRNFTYTSYASSSLHGIICNKGTLILQGCKIYDNELKFSSNSDYVVGGVVYNEGTMRVLSGEFYGNKAINGNGGFVYSAGKLTVSGGTISNNKSGSGAGVYVANGGSATLLSGQITHNIAQNNGGGIYVADGGELVLDNTQILSNIASGEGAGLYKGEGGSVLLSSGEKVLTSTIESVEAMNTIESPEQIVQNDNLTTILNVICVLIAIAIFVILIVKSKKSQTFYKK